MFYLLEDNRIIDSRISYTRNFPYWEIKDNCLFAKSKNDKLVRPCHENKIKKQSENVFDLIEEGDLVNTIVDSIYQVTIVQKNTIFAPQWFFDWAVVNAIYKPDANGNYIKVWELKEGE